MAEAIRLSTAKRVPLKAYLATDHISAATGKTIAVVISKNGAAFGNPSAGATTATEIGAGWYYVDLSTTDTGTAGPLLVRGTEGTIDPAEIVYTVGAGGTAPTAIEIADEILKRDWTAVSGEAARSVLNALRFLRNKWSISAGTLTISREDDTTVAWTATLTSQAGAASVTASDPT